MESLSWEFLLGVLRLHLILNAVSYTQVFSFSAYHILVIFSFLIIRHSWFILCRITLLVFLWSCVCIISLHFFIFIIPSSVLTPHSHHSSACSLVPVPFFQQLNFVLPCQEQQRGGQHELHPAVWEAAARQHVSLMPLGCRYQATRVTHLTQAAVYRCSTAHWRLNTVFTRGILYRVVAPHTKFTQFSLAVHVGKTIGVGKFSLAWKSKIYVG